MIKLKIILILLVFAVAFFVGTKAALGQFIIQPHPYCTNPSLPACWSTRRVNQRICSQCLASRWVCAESIPPSDPPKPLHLCEDIYGDQNSPECVGDGPCRQYCTDWSSGGPCLVFDQNVICDTSGSNCNWTGGVWACNPGNVNCSESQTMVSLGCCGPGGVIVTPTPGVGGSPTPTPAPASCTISLPNMTLTAGDPAQEVFAATSAFGGSIISVAFSSSNPTVATVTSPDASGPPFSTFVTPLSPGTSIFTAIATMNTGSTCDTSLEPRTITVQNPIGWWQVKDGDITTNGSIQSPIPGTCVVSPSCDEFLVNNNIGNVPGVPLYGGNLILNQGFASQNPPWGWKVNTNYSAITEYKYAFYERLIPGDTIRNPIAGSTIGVGLLISAASSVSPDGYKWFFKDGDVTLNRQGLTSNKIILFVDGNLTIDGEINLDDGRGFFMAIVSGNIIVEPNINVAGPEIEGIFVTDQTFITAADDDQLHIRGMVSAYNANSSGPIIMGRNLADNTRTPSEIFEYAPDLLFNYPPSLTLKRTRWKEVTP